MRIKVHSLFTGCSSTTYSAGGTATACTGQCHVRIRMHMWVRVSLCDCVSCVYVCEWCVEAELLPRGCARVVFGECSGCPGISGCSSRVTCTSSSNSQCTSCSSGRYLAQATVDSCPTCTQISGCASTETCSTSGNSQCTSCAVNTYLAQGTADSCPGAVV